MTNEFSLEDSMYRKTAAIGVGLRTNFKKSAHSVDDPMLDMTTELDPCPRNCNIKDANRRVVVGVDQRRRRCCFVCVQQLNTTSLLLQTLAVVDIAYLVTCLFVQSLKTVNDSTDWIPALRSTIARLEPYIWLAASTAQTATIWTVLLLTVDRYIAVCSPFDPGLRTLRRARIWVVVVLLAAIAYNAPQVAEREAFEETDLCTGEKRWRVRKTDAFGDLYFIIYKTVSYFIFRTVGPLVALVVLNARLIAALNRSRQRRKQLASGSNAPSATGDGHRPAAGGSHGGGGRHRENITLMLVVVVSVFIVCQLPDLGLRIAATHLTIHVCI